MTLSGRIAFEDQALLGGEHTAERRGETMLCPGAGDPPATGGTVAYPGSRRQRPFAAVVGA